MKNFKLGIIGCGAVVELKHLPALERVPQLTISGLVDLDIKRAESLKRKFRLFDAMVYDSYHEILKRNDIDIIIIATPPKTHAQIAISALKANKHVYCEKPLATSIEDAKSILYAVKSSDSKFMIGFNFRFQSHYMMVKNLIVKNFIGKFLASDIYFLGDITSWPTLTRFQFTLEEGGALFDSGIHCIDLARWMFGEVKKVYANIGTYSLNIPVDDTATVFLEHKNGAVSLLHISWGAPSLNCIKMIGDKGIIIAALDKNYIQTTKIGFENRWFRISLKNFSPLSSHQRAFTHFIECILNKKKPNVSVDDGIKSLQITLAAYESSKKGKPVDILR